MFVGDRTEGQRETTADDPGTQPVMELKVSVCSRAAGSESRHQALGRLPGAVGGSPSLEGFKHRGDVALGDMV